MPNQQIRVSRCVVRSCMHKSTLLIHTVHIQIQLPKSTRTASHLWIILTLFHIILPHPINKVMHVCVCIRFMCMFFIFFFLHMTSNEQIHPIRHVISFNALFKMIQRFNLIFHRTIEMHSIQLANHTNIQQERHNNNQIDIMKKELVN